MDSSGFALSRREEYCHNGGVAFTDSLGWELYLLCRSTTDPSAEGV
jgi:hypothetical protein